MSGFSGSNDYMGSPPPPAAVENMSGFKDSGGDSWKIPPGFRFHPTDEELITHYLSKKIVDSSFRSTAIAEVDLNKHEPWDLPSVAAMGEREWYFFCPRDRKYSTGLRTNRATNSGYWKATGKDREICKEGSGSIIIGMKKTLVFHRGRAPRGEKTDWVMHEYRSQAKHNLLKNFTKNEWVICRVFRKSSKEKKTDISRMTPSMMDHPLLMNLMQTIQTLPKASNVDEHNIAASSSCSVGFHSNTTTMEDKNNSGVWVKVGYNNDTVMFMLPSETLDSLKTQILKRYKFEADETFKIRYKDEDEEMVTIACDEDLNYCLEFFKSTGKTPVRLFLFKE